MPALEVRLLEHTLREPTCTVNMVPTLQGSSLLSIRKMAGADYVMIYDGKEVKVHDGCTTQITVSERAMLQE